MNRIRNKSFKISFCTVCMNRLHHLKITLPQNIKDNIDYENIEFVVLNYNSIDGLDEWIKSEMKDFLDNGILRYYYSKEPEDFHMSHSKNVVAKLSTGDIICNIDADNFTGIGFAEYVNSSFMENKNIYLGVDKDTRRDCCGRISVERKDFYKIGGYDEKMSGYGFDDYDLCNRLQLLGRKTYFIKDNKFLQALPHTDEERTENEYNSKEIEFIYIRFINHSVSELLYLFKNKKCYLGKIVHNKTYNSESINNLFTDNNSFEFPTRLYGNKWNIGRWKNIKNGIEFITTGNSKVAIDDNNQIHQLTTYSPDLKKFYPIIEKKMFKDKVLFFSQISNRLIMEKNLKEKRVSVNDNSFGKIKLI